jgi:hypothetical protein
MQALPTRARWLVWASLTFAVLAVTVGFGCVLTEYQFAGDAEGHAVPAIAHTS